MRGIVLAAGRGRRLGAVGEGRPKCLVELGGRSLLQVQREALCGAGISKLALVSGYRGDQLPRRDWEHFANPRWAETGVVTSLLAGRAWLEVDTCIVSYADIAYGPAVVAALRDTPGDVAITSFSGWRALWEARFPDPLLDAETFEVDSTGMLVDIGRRASNLNQIQGQFMGLVKLTTRGFASVVEYLNRNPGEAERIDMTTLLRGLVHSGVPVQTRSVSEFWYEIDSVADVELYPTWAAAHSAV